MRAERDDALTPAQEILVRVLTNAIVEDLLEQGLTPGHEPPAPFDEEEIGDYDGAIPTGPA
jgi:hypothetical protein